MLGESPSSATRSYLPSSISQIFNTWLNPPPLQPERHPLSIEIIKSIAHHIPSTPSQSPSRHDISPDLVQQNASWNSLLIARHNFDLQDLIDSYPHSVISPGSEFRDAKILEPLLKGHPHWPRLRHILQKGVSYLLIAEEYDPARQRENEAILAYGNHASGKKNPDALASVIQKDVAKGYSVPITFECARRIRHGRISPMGVANQLGINEHGDLIPKNCHTHDQSFSLGFCPAVNELIDQSRLIHLTMGHCLDRLFRQIVGLRLHYPSSRILICKYDWTSAYRRITGDGAVAARSITIDPSHEFAHIALRLTFGAPANPAEFSVVSETCTDLCKDLVDCLEWQPSICSSPLHRDVGHRIRLDDSIPFNPAQLLAVNLPIRPQGFHDVYLDDMIQLFLNHEVFLPQSPCIVPLAIHLMSRPVAADEPIPRKEMFEESKLRAEGSSAELQRVLGWTIDTRRLLLRLPNDKIVGWSKQLQQLLQTRSTNFATLESIIGKLQHATKGTPHPRLVLAAAHARL